LLIVKESIISQHFLTFLNFYAYRHRYMKIRTLGNDILNSFPTLLFGLKVKFYKISTV